MAPTDNLASLREEEDRLRTHTLAYIAVNEELRDHLYVVREAMNVIWGLTHDYEHKVDDELTIQFLGSRRPMVGPGGRRQVRWAFNSPTLQQSTPAHNATLPQAGVGECEVDQNDVEKSLGRPSAVSRSQKKAPLAHSGTGVFGLCGRG